MHQARLRIVFGAAACAAVLLLNSPAPASGADAPAAAGAAAAPVRLAAADFTQHLDANNLGMVLSNIGSFAYDYFNTGGGGLEYPLGSGKSLMFAAGLWLGSQSPTGTRVVVAEYGSEYGCGSMLPGGIADIRTRPEYKVFKLLRQYPDNTSRDAALADYLAGAVPHGAPGVTVLDDGTLGILGDQMAWCVFNDADPSLHTGYPGSTAPLGVEVRQTAFAYNLPGAPGNTEFLRFQIVNRGTFTLYQMYVSLWADPDLGGFSDDLVGYDAAHGIGYCYNGTNSDLLYGAQPPAVGLMLLQGPAGYAQGPRLAATSFVPYVNGTDPGTAAQTYAYMRGLNSDGTPFVDPTTFNTTPFVYSGDPIAGTGWIDPTPTDQRMMLSSGPIVLAPGDSTDCLAALVVGQGADRLSSIAALRSNAATIRSLYGNLPTLAVGPQNRAGAPLAVRASPNPARNECAIAFRLDQDGPARLEVFDVNGRRVSRQDLAAAAAGPHVDRLDVAGQANGLYFVRVSQAGHSATARLVVAR